MKSKSIVLLAIILVLGSVGIQLRQYLGGQADDLRSDAVRKVLDDQVAAWNSGDLDGFMVGYWRSDELRFYSGDRVTSGWQATLERYQKKYQSDGAEMGTLAFTDLQIDSLGPDAALVRGRWHLTRSKDTPHGLFTLAMRRFPEGWRIIHDHTSAAE